MRGTVIHSISLALVVVADPLYTRYMEPRVSELLQDAQKLNHEDMADLVHELLRAFDPPEDMGNSTPSDDAVDRAWEQEALQRLHEIETGSVQCVNGQETLARARRQLADRRG